jgi:hypothetical protein
MRFKQFILNEQTAYLGQKVGDILTATQELRDDAKNMGSRDLVRFSERIVNQIRRILHSNWPREETKHLKILQKVAVALMKAVDEKEDLPETISGAAGTLEKLVGNLGIPINKLGTSDEAEDETEDDSGLSKSEKPDNLSSPPPKSSTIEKAGPVAPPNPTGQDIYAPPLGGSSGPMDTMG